MAELRRARPEDVDGALEVWRAARAAAGARPPAARLAQVREQLADPAAVLVVAVTDDDDVVGAALGTWGRADGELVPGLLQLELLVAHPSHRRQGLGGALAEALADEAYGKGARRLQAWTPADDDAAGAFLEAVGLEPTGAQRDGLVERAAELDPPESELVVREAGLRLGQLLKLAGLVETGAEGKALLAEGGVQVNGEVELRRGYQVAGGDVVVARDRAVRVVLPEDGGASR